MGNFLTLSFWLDMRPGELHFSGMLFFLVLILVFVAIMVLFRIANKRKNNIYFKIWRSLNSFATANLILSLFLLFFEYEGIYIFSARFWLLLWLASMIFWLMLVLKDYKKIPEIKKEHEERKEFEKYIP